MIREHLTKRHEETLSTQTQDTALADQFLEKSVPKEEETQADDVHQGVARAHHGAGRVLPGLWWSWSSRIPRNPMRVLQGTSRVVHDQRRKRRAESHVRMKSYHNKIHSDEFLR